MNIAHGNKGGFWRMSRGLQAKELLKHDDPDIREGAEQAQERLGDLLGVEDESYGDEVDDEGPEEPQSNEAPSDEMEKILAIVKQDGGKVDNLSPKQQKAYFKYQKENY